MANKHYKRWLFQMPIGYLLVTLAVFLIMYAANKSATDEWVIWGVICSIVLIAGLILLGSAYIHKVKSDLIKRDRQKYRSASDTTAD